MKEIWTDYFEIIFFYEITNKKFEIPIKTILKVHPFIPKLYDKLYINVNAANSTSEELIYFYLLNEESKYIFFSNVTKERKKEIKDLSFKDLKKKFNLISTDITRTYKVYDTKGSLVTNFDIEKIISHYPFPLYLSPLYIINQSLESADFNLVYFGYDKKNKVQYIYGKMFVQNRNQKRDLIFKKVVSKIEKIKSYIDTNLPTSKKKIQKNNLLAVLLLLELNSFIRTGRIKYYNENNTIGILTLETSNIKFNSKDSIILEFIGKKGIKQSFIIKEKQIVDSLKMIYNPKYIFLFTDSKGKRLSESFLDSTLKNFNLTLKDIRTYGVNMILIKNIHTAIKNLDVEFSSKTEIKKIINKIIKLNSEFIGHSSSISKISYISNKVLEYLYDNFNNIKKITSKELLDEILEIL